MKKQYALPIEMLQKWAAEKPDEVYLRQPVNRQYITFTWRECYDAVRRMAAALQSMGFKKGDRIGILSKNCAEWFLADFAIQAAGYISTPIYYTASAETISFIVDHADIKAVFMGKLDDFAPSENGIREGVVKIALPYDTIDCDHSWKELLSAHKPLPEPELAKPDLDELFSIVYTSGSTGDPKGVELTWRNIAYGAWAPTQSLELQPNERLLSYLPLAHITERALVEHVSLYSGVLVSFVESLDTFAEDLRAAEVTMFLSVPRLWMKFQSGILAKAPQKKLDRLLKIPVLSWFVKRKIRDQLGLANAKIIGSGSAPISKAVLDWYRKIGINITEGWGMTETTGLASSHHPFRADKLGTIGTPLTGLEIKISDEGELLIRGDSVARGYYKKPELTAEVVETGGWFHTGDKVQQDADGFLSITGRVKEIFKSSKGKYIAPVPIEAMLFDNTFVEQACVMGSNLAQPAGVVFLSSEVTQGLSREEVRKSLEKTYQDINSSVESHLKLSSIVVVNDMWTIDNGYLTPTMKIKRSVLENRYQEVVQNMPRRPVVWEDECVAETVV
ncbi:Long-chain-fatty-acid--CoA ligase FadD15 [Pseudovibrio axinellae]|uniref:Long-chain-fatty-acid--CoA ligase FadD15 n=1 Tax=Pseudovibrio axinellae TaxID=989403 RepID=A0A165XQM4_9HYPH|nr:AMP-binding protein [Pseudovibrio axinellae]KZL17946.1 Long-chain-fatty-acid--CoA ligase FadD15 [Pseudovibrio axinellae]SER15734.1 long-chain acyl-CoA synthetase [Pseudovibrio axinellae]